MADLTVIRTALAAQITAQTGLRTMAQARDQVSPPVAVIIPREPVVVYGDTMDAGPVMPEAVTVNLSVVLLLSDAAPSEKTQRALDAYLGIGAGETVSIAGAVQADPTLGGTVHSALPVSVSSYNRVVWADVQYFGARVNLEILTF